MVDLDETIQPGGCFNSACIRCPRIARNLAQIKRDYPGYHAAPVASFGAADPALLIVGLGPGLHGANATGRPFTGDYAGILLYKTLHAFGFSNQPVATGREDGLVLHRCRITNAVKCLPPGNKPLTTEIKNCNTYLGNEIRSIHGRLVILALGRIAHEAVLRALDIRQKDHRFGHNRVHSLQDNRILVDSYHCSRYNTQTRRLTEDMFRQVFSNITDILHD